MFTLATLISLPALALTLHALINGEALVTTSGMYLSYLLYLAVWVMLILFFSVIARTRSIALGGLCVAWFLSCLVIPRIGVATVSALLPIDGKFVTDIKMMDDIRALGNGHDASDPAFAKLKRETLQKYQVDNVEALPFNYRGLLAGIRERKLTDLMNKYAEERMEQELAQSHTLRLLSFLSPFVAIDYCSRHFEGTDLSTHHRFLRETEKPRFHFVQKLNEAHEKQLSYTLDVNRNKTEADFNEASVSSEN